MAANPTVTEAPFVPLQDVDRDTIPKIFLRAVERHDRADAMRYKAAGGWKTLSHREIEEQVTALAAAFGAAGIQRGDRVAILSENRPEWAITDFAATGIGAMDVPVYPTLPPGQIEYILRDCSAKAVVVSTPEQLQKIQEIRGSLPALEIVVSMDDPGATPDVEYFPRLLDRGRKAIAAGEVPNFREAALSVERDDVATLIYTSGTTGNPKGVMLTNYNLASNVAASRQHDVVRPQKGDVALSFLPLSHVLERMVDYWHFDSGLSIAYAESIEKVADNLLEVSPTLVLSVPRLFDKIYTKVMGATGIKRRLLLWAKGVGESVVDLRFEGKEPSPGLAFQYRIADRLVFSKLRARTGGRLRAFISGGAPLSADVAKFFFAAGLPVYEGYGLTETSPVISVNRPSDVKLGSVGKPLPGVEVRLDANGQILTRGPHVMKGYWNNPEATAETIDSEGWLHTGDVGELTPDGFLRITDRIKNIIVTAGGKNIAPQPMENAAAMSPYVAQAVVIGDRRPFPIVVLLPDFENLTTWASAQGISGTPRELSDDPRVREHLEQEVMSRLDAFARYEVPKKVCVVDEEFTIEGGLLTPSLKVKRKQVEERFRDQIEALYEGDGAPA